MSVTTSEFTRNCGFLIPAYNPGSLLRGVLEELKRELVSRNLDSACVVCVDDGSTDGTFKQLPKMSGLELVILRHEKNFGKGTALRTGLQWAASRGMSQMVSLDADGQHPAFEAVRLFCHPAPPNSLVLAVRDMKGAGAPTAAQASNAFSNSVLSLMGGETLQDTQCGLRRYPVRETLALGAPSPGYAYESDVVLRAARTGLKLVHEPCEVVYPREEDRLSFFDSVRDPTRIVFRVVATTLSVPHHRPLRRWSRRMAWVLLVGFAFYLLVT